MSALLRPNRDTVRRHRQRGGGPDRFGPAAEELDVDAVTIHLHSSCVKFGVRPATRGEIAWQSKAGSKTRRLQT